MKLYLDSPYYNSIPDPFLAQATMDLSLGNLAQTPYPTCLNHIPNKSNTWMSDASNRIHMSAIKASQERGCRVYSLVYRSIAAIEPDMIKYNTTIQWVISNKDICLGRRDKETNETTFAPWTIYLYKVEGIPST